MLRLMSEQPKTVSYRMIVVQYQYQIGELRLTYKRENVSLSVALKSTVHSQASRGSPTKTRHNLIIQNMTGDILAVVIILAIGVPLALLIDNWGYTKNRYR